MADIVPRPDPVETLRLNSAVRRVTALRYSARRLPDSAAIAARVAMPAEMAASVFSVYQIGSWISGSGPIDGIVTQVLSRRAASDAAATTPNANQASRLPCTRTHSET